MQVEGRTHEDNGSPMVHRGFQGRGHGRGGGIGQGRDPIICYNCGKVGNYAQDCQNFTHPSCQYCRKFDHVIEDCLVLMAKM